VDENKTNPLIIFLIAGLAFLIAVPLGSAMRIPWLMFVPLGAAGLWAVVDWYLLPIWREMSRKD